VGLLKEMAALKDKFCLKWNDFESNISAAFRELREDKDFFDVTLACDDDQIQAHKVILSACSPFFRKVLRRNKHEHPLLYLKGVKYADLVAVLSFMYHGEVDISQEDLNTFLAVAQDLKVKGLTEKVGDSTTKQGQNESTKTQSETLNNQVIRKAPNIPEYDPGTKSRQHTSSNNVLPSRMFKTDTPDYDEIQEVSPMSTIKTEAEPEQVVTQPIQSFNSSASSSYAMINTVQDDTMLDDYTNYEDGDQMYAMGEPMTFSAGDNKGLDYDESELDRLIETMLSKVDVDGVKLWSCNVCSKQHKKRSNITVHIESVHIEGFTHSCKICFSTHSSRSGLNFHMSTKHRADRVIAPKHIQS